ncbi:MAG: cytochrome P450 [Gammaproteobacteria bacterium]|jgi:cytochrome P450
MSTNDKPKAMPDGAALSARDPRFRDDPDPVYDRLREHAPYYDDRVYGRTLLTRHDDVRAALRHKRFSVDARLSAPDSYLRRVAGTGVVERDGDAAYTPPLVLLDDPDHRRIRLLMSKAFNPQSIEAMRGRIEVITRELLDACNGRDSIDLIADFAAPLPTQAILEMMGMPEGRRDDFKRWSEEILMGYDPDRDASTQARLRDAYIAMGREFQHVVDARRETPRDDLISAMVRAQEDADRLTDLEIISLCTQLIVAGNVTTTDLIGNGVFALLENPDEFARLRADPELVDNAVEEMLRFDCPITETARIPMRDDTLNGCPVHAGTTLTASLAAANHDPAVFPDPHRFDITRDAAAHLAFGSGIHVCLGAPLARLEGRIAIRELVARWPRLRRDPERTPQRRALPFFRGFTCLPLRIA